MKKKLIGRKDILNFPRLKLEGIEVKIDTGAYSSSIHCRDIKLGQKNGKKVITFVLLDPTHPKYHGKKFTSSTFKEKYVKSSNGVSEKRFVITTDVLIYEEKYKIELSLTERGEMRFNWHFCDHDIIDPYFGLAAGYRSNNWEFTSTDPDFVSTETGNLIPFGIEATFGTRFLFTDNLGAYVELGLARAFFQVGLTGKF